MNDNTWFKMFRKSEYSAVFQDANLWKIWCWCLIRASHKEQHFPVQTGRGTTIVSVQPGQFIFGRFSASKSLRMKPSSIWDRMKKLANLQNIGIQTDSHYSIITITKWNDYQNDIYKSDSQSDKQPTSNRHIQE